MSAASDWFRNMLATDEHARRAYLGEVLYHVQCDLTCQLLDVAAEVVGESEAVRIAYVIYDQLAEGEKRADAALKTVAKLAPHTKIL